VYYKYTNKTHINQKDKMCTINILKKHMNQKDKMRTINLLIKHI